MPSSKLLSSPEITVVKDETTRVNPGKFECIHQDPLVHLLSSEELSQYYDPSMEWSRTNFLGSGSFGIVYRGDLSAHFPYLLYEFYQQASRF